LGVYEELRRFGHLCDVTLVAGGSSFSVHRVMLAACGCG
jgi:hypothetical protein